jgi:glycopeptide antibiotics resistance protein
MNWVMISDNLKTMTKRLISAFILIAYSAILFKVMVFKDMPVIRIGPLMLNFGGTHEGAANLLPFKTILPYLLGEKGLIIAGINLVGNIALLVPIGFLVPFVFRNITWKKTLALAVAAGFVIEGMQVVLHVGIFDIDDVILNALGVVIGYWAFAILANWVRLGKYKTIIITAIIVIATAVAALYAIYPKDQQPVNSVRGAEKVESDSFENGEGGIPQGEDPCNGTGGTGQIVSVGNNTITIKRGDGISQIIKLTDQTKIRNSAGPVSKSDLKTGNRVTVVIDGSETATIVLVCNASITKPIK